MTALQLFDALPAHIEDALRASIRRFGVIVPIAKDQDGRIIDGHHRARIAHEEGIDCPERQISVADDDEAREIARTLNSDRRHLTEDQRREVVAELRRAGHSYRAIGGALGISHEQARKDDRATAGVNGLTPDQPATVRGLDGKEYAASRPQPTPEPSPQPEPAPRPDLGIGEFWDAGEPEPDPPPLPDRQDEADAATAHAERSAGARAEPEWTKEEAEFRRHLEAGETAVVNMRTHPNLIAWAEQRGLYVRIDRKSPWGNPYLLGDDGDRATVIDNYETHYLPHKPSLLARLPELKGKALGCWCAPDDCHGDVLKARAEE